MVQTGLGLGWFSGMPFFGEKLVYLLSICQGVHLKFVFLPVTHSIQQAILSRMKPNQWLPNVPKDFFFFFLPRSSFKDFHLKKSKAYHNRRFFFSFFIFLQYFEIKFLVSGPLERWWRWCLEINFLTIFYFFFVFRKTLQIEILRIFAEEFKW